MTEQYLNHNISNNRINKILSVFMDICPSIILILVTVSISFGQTQTFTSSGTFIVPNGVSTITVECWGGGGAGGGQSANSVRGGGGGAGGAYAKKTLSVTPGDSYAVTVAGIKTGALTAGANGDPSWFGTTGTVYAEGGIGGSAPTGGNVSGGSGSSASSIGDIVYAGGNGGGGSSTFSGGGGGGAGSTGNGGNASNATKGYDTDFNGGAGGAGLTSGGAGNAGSNYGAGGSGAYVNNNTNRAGGAGAQGLVVITWASMVYSASGSFVVPAGVNLLTVEAWGAGGGGSTRTSTGFGGGGGGGAYASGELTVIPGSSYTVSIGNGGAANTSGGNTSFDTDKVLAAGGGGATNNSTIAGAGGTVAASIGTTKYAGGNGAAGGSTYSGGGGGGAGSSGKGNDAPASDANSGAPGSGSSLWGGNGGAGINTNSNGNKGNNYGGGGGGARRTTGTRTGGAGANGFMVISWKQPVFYYIGSGDPTVNTNWQTIEGYSPDNFTDDFQTFVIKTGQNATTIGAWSISGINTALIVQNGGTLTENYTISVSANTTLQIDDGAILNHNVDNLSLFGGCKLFGSLSTINYGLNGSQTVLDFTYGNLTLSGSGLKMIGNTTVNGIFSLEGTAVASASPVYGAGSTLQYKGSDIQVTGFEASSTFTGTGGIIINNVSGVTLGGHLTVSSSLTMIQGNIDCAGYTLSLTNSNSASLIYYSGIITGKFQREIGLPTGVEYLFPVGTNSTGHPLKISFSNLTAGQLAVQFVSSDIGTTGLPLNDGGQTINDRFSTGYWTMTALSSLASTNYNVNLNCSGFTGIDALSRIMTRDNGGNLVLKGTHGSLTGLEITRTGISGISTIETDLAVGKPNPRITTQPSDFTGCTSSFTVAAIGNPVLTYQWQENAGGGFVNITDGGMYSGSYSTRLTISGAQGYMNGYQYRCMVTDGSGYVTGSNSATLTINLPVVSFGYNYSMDLTINQASGAADLTDFPVLISITSNSLKSVSNGGKVTNNNGFDIIFTNLDGSGLDHQIDSYNASTGQYLAWVRIPLLSHTATTKIKMLYGNSTITANPSVKTVWSSNYKGVWHFNGTDYTDATVNLNNGTNVATTNITGKISDAKNYNGSTSYVTVTTSGFVPNNNNQTISTWAKYSTAPTDTRNLVTFQNTGASSAIQVGFRGGNAVSWKWEGTILANGGVCPSANIWHYYVYTFDGTTSRIYIDGVEKNSSTEAPQTAMPLEGNIGRYNDGEYFNGGIDETRFSMSPKTGGWISTEYSNQNNPAGFISFGTEESSAELPSVGVCSTTYLLNQGTPSGGTYSGPGVSGTNFNASVAGVGTHQITYTYTDVNGCVNSAVKNIVVTGLPSAPVASNSECCVLNIFDLEAVGTNLKWYSDAGLTSLVGNGSPFATGKTTTGVYTYYVTQTINGCQSPATTVTLTVYNSFTINSQPQPQSICTGSDAVFSVNVSGYNITYKWQEGGINISDGADYSGTDTPVLTLIKPGIAKNGKSYRCVITSTCGISPTNSNSALLTVTSMPVATFNYAGSPYCPNAPNPSPTFIGGGTAGTFSSASGLVFTSATTGVVDMAASTPGTYTVTNTLPASGGCGVVTATSQITIISELLWTGSIDNNWNNAGNWFCGFIPVPATDIRIPNVTNKPVLNSGSIGTVKNLTIESGSSLTILSNKIEISGTITNNGSFDATDGIIELNGTSSQVIGNNVFSSNTIKDLIINNSAGVTLQGQLNITGILTPQNGNLASDGYLTLVSNATQTALISGSGNGSVSGNVTMQRYLSSGFGYKYFSSPFLAATVNEFGDDMNLSSSFTLFYKYDENRIISGVPASGWVGYKTVTNVLNPLAGYAVNFGSNTAPLTVDVTGVVNSGNISSTLYNNNNKYTKGFNLVGNPYPSPIDWDATGWTKTKIDNAVYYFRAGTDQYGGTYSTYINGVSSDGQATNIIPSMQGFFVHVSDGSYPVTGTLGMDNSVRVSDKTHPFARTVNNKRVTSLIRLNVSFEDDRTLSDNTVIYFDEEAKNEFDSRLDALKLMNTDSKIPNTYTLISGGTKLSINSLPDIREIQDTIPLGIKILKSGSVVFRTNVVEGDVNEVYISDLILGTSQKLDESNEYKIYLNSGEYTNRFLLIYSLKKIVPEEPEIIPVEQPVATPAVIANPTTETSTDGFSDLPDNKPEENTITDNDTESGGNAVATDSLTGISICNNDYKDPVVPMVNIYSSHGKVIAIINNLPSGDGNIYIYNLTGQPLFTAKVHKTGYYEYSPLLKDGFYIARYISGSASFSQKIFIQNR